MKNLFSLLKIFPIGVSWFIPVENVKSGPKENLPKHYGPGICWFAPITNTKPWREPLREQNWQGQHMDSHRPLAGPGRDPLKPFVRATLQVQWHWVNFSRMFKGVKRGSTKKLRLWLSRLKNSHVTLIPSTSVVRLFPLSLIKGCLTVNHYKLGIALCTWGQGKRREDTAMLLTGFVDACTWSAPEVWYLRQPYVCSSTYVTPIPAQHKVPSLYVPRELKEMSFNNVFIWREI